MDYIQIANTDLKVSRLALGMMRIAEKNEEEVEILIREALAQGINFFDHADIYGKGECERIFGKVLAKNPELREQMLIQSKCDIVQEYAGGLRYDTSREYIMNQVQHSLERLHTSHLDILLLHRPDALCDPVELSETFDELHEKKLVRYFGVSNHSVGKLRLLNKYLKQPLICNQLQFSIIHSHMLDSDFFVNMADDHAADRDHGMLDYCRLHDITVQTWCPLQASWADGSFIDNPKYARLNALLESLAAEYRVTKSAIALAWILRHPANMQAVIGTTSPVHLRESCEALKVCLTRQQWYDLYMAENKRIP
ncbi:MAG: aldo/keto reductase [Muribaculaceae bacterium]|nr:aldo/keto reductase [Roseburia sp.]MCM1430592.1 aldo/keto reductase [Muribaculaceae bacterium]MCM1492699.1 aldo/keto reductase [Muribaculaceae bacterium]